ncbi:hypothetical protein MLD38_002226 [Melastoma candidum]|uniref:Uncharacterized protein n=1 Tax=Melastoma candidum TaxID=119954 RepID=A0ACB9SF53_9MYRT|nr:hypothetical protein MLD38_002226 [Melastoma candidum]
MRCQRAAVLLAALLAASLVSTRVVVSAQGSTNRSSPWLTLTGNAPLVVARGGVSGVFPDSSSLAYGAVTAISVPDVVFWCDVQLTKDWVGICAPHVNLDNSTDIANVYKNRSNSYVVNGAALQGWFSIDFTMRELGNVKLIRGVLSRTNRYDENSLAITTVQDLIVNYTLPGLWLNAQHDAFFTQHNLNMRSFVLSVMQTTLVDYISSPEVNFLKSIASRVTSKTKLIFRFMGQGDLEPSTNHTYGSFLKNLTSVKAFASGILVPKSYIWPVDSGNYLRPYTTLVSDAHKAGLLVFAGDFANDVPFSYNYSYDPVAETLSYVDNGAFSVDGVLTDFPITPSEAIGCFAHVGKNSTAQANFLVISYNGASGDYPGCTDVAYTNAISDGADIIDCNVQMSMDGTPFCLSTINLIDTSLAAQLSFSNLTTKIPEIQSDRGIFSFSLLWSDIQTLPPSISNPYSYYQLFRNPKNKNAGKFLSLSDFLSLAWNSSVSGVLINIENAVYLAQNQGLDITDAVLNTLNKSSYSNQTLKKVMIKSTNSSVLTKIKGTSNYELVYEVDENIRDAMNSTIQDIKSFAHSVVVTKESIYPQSASFLIGMTNIVTRLQEFNLSVYAQVLENEFVSQAYDYYADATVQLNSFVMGAGVDGIITDFPKTAAAYKRNKCLGLGKNTPNYMSPVPPGGLVSLITATPMLPPAEAPDPILTDADVSEPPLPPVSARPPTPSPPSASSPPPVKSKNGQTRAAAHLLVSSVVGFLATLLLH